MQLSQLNIYYILDIRYYTLVREIYKNLARKIYKKIYIIRYITFDMISIS